MRRPSPPDAASAADWVASASPSEQPAHEVALTTATGSTVTRSRTRLRGARRRRRLPGPGALVPDGWAWLSGMDAARRRSTARATCRSSPDGLTWFEADAYAAWPGGRLPTEVESGVRGSWTRVAGRPVRATRSTRPRRCHRQRRPKPVGSYPTGVSWSTPTTGPGTSMAWVSDRLAADGYATSPIPDPDSDAATVPPGRECWWRSIGFVDASATWTTRTDRRRRRPIGVRSPGSRPVHSAAMDRRSALVLLAVFGAGVFLAGLELMITAVALPSILADLVDANGTSAWVELRKASWIINGYLLVYILVMPLAGPAGRPVGRPAAVPGGARRVHRRVAALAGRGPEPRPAHRRRLVQAVGGGVLVPVGTAAAAHLFGGARAAAGARGHRRADVPRAWPPGRSSGRPILGAVHPRRRAGRGRLADSALADSSRPAWRWVFYVNVPIGIVGAASLAWAAGAGWETPRRAGPGRPARGRAVRGRPRGRAARR